MQKVEDQKSLQLWLQTALGQYLVATEQQLLTKVLAQLAPKMFGYHVLLLGEKEFMDCACTININHRVLIHHRIDAPQVETPRLYARQDKLPVASESVDVVYLAHCLEVATNPHEVLREAYRVLRPEGHLIISGFNPCSSWGLWRILARITGKAPWSASFMSNLKIKDWLYLLGFDVLINRGYCYALPINHGGFLAKFRRIENLGMKLKLPFGAANLVIACKRVIALTPLRPVWQDKQRLSVDSAVKPVVNNEVGNC